MRKPKYIGFATLQLSKLFMYETYYDEIQQYFRREIIQLLYKNCDGFVLSIKTQNSNKYLKNVEDLFDFSTLDENHGLFSNKNKKVMGKFKIETLKKIYIYELVALISKMFAINCGYDGKKI